MRLGLPPFGRPVVPEVEYGAIRDGRVPEETRQAIRRTGTAVVRGVFPRTSSDEEAYDVAAYQVRRTTDRMNLIARDS